LSVQTKRLALAACLALLPQTVLSAEPTRANAYTQPHVLRYATAEDITGLNQVLSQQTVVNYMSQLTMAWLFRWDKNNRPQPELATVVPTKANGGISADGKAITYHLRRGVKWSDGAPFDADDVRFSFGVMNNRANNVTSREGWELVDKIDEPNKETLVVHLREPYSLFMPTFFTSAAGNPCILPKHLLAGLPDINTAPYNNLPVGIGPFKYTAWKRGESVEMVANPLYWRGTPKLHKIVYKIIPDRNTVLTQLQTGELDLWVPFGGSFMSRVQAMHNVVLGRHAIYTVNHFDLNMSRPALRDRVVRQALRYATDRPTIREKVNHGVGILQDSVLPAPYPGVSGVPYASYDIARANAMLDRAAGPAAATAFARKTGSASAWILRRQRGHRTSIRRTSSSACRGSRSASKSRSNTISPRSSSRNSPTAESSTRGNSTCSRMRADRGRPTTCFTTGANSCRRRARTRRATVTPRSRRCAPISNAGTTRRPKIAISPLPSRSSTTTCRRS